MSSKRKKHFGSSFEDFLKEDGTYEEITVDFHGVLTHLSVLH
jgi:hypothetical protein